MSEADGERLVLGTAGHIDHGKTALIRALTGVDTDRLPEEKNRGITIELGFAPLDLADRRLSVIDVPGHEKLVRTMIAGATGIDLVLLVVAADEGVMPQTREHVAICDLLGIESCVVALTKIDLADGDLVDLAEVEVAELLAGTSLEDARFVRVSAHEGTGIDDLRQALLELAEKAGARTARFGPPRLAVDRAFSARGFGSVVTGTLTGGPLHEGDEVVLLPNGPSGRIRGLQAFGESSDRVAPGGRCAVNVHGAPLEAIERGQVLARPERLLDVPSFDAMVRLLPGAPTLDEPSSVSVLAGSAERRARIAPLGGEAIEPGGRGFARVHVEGDPLILLPGDRFVVRGFSRLSDGGGTLGGGVVVDIAPARKRPGDPRLVADLAVLAAGDEGAGLVLRATRSGFAGISEQRLALESGSEVDRVRELLEAADDSIARTDAGVWIDERVLARLSDELVGRVADFHRSERLRPGIPKRTLAAALPENTGAGVFDLLLGRLCGSRALEVRDDLVCDPEHLPMLSQQEEAILAHIRAEAMSKEFEPPTFREWLDMFPVDERQLRDFLAYLEREGALIRAPGDLWFDAVAVDALRERVRTHLREEGQLETPAYKDLIGTTRKYAVPLMELFDAERLTVRRGEVRILRRASESS